MRYISATPIRVILLLSLLISASSAFAQRHPHDSIISKQIDTLNKLIVSFKDQVVLFNAGLRKDSSGIKGVNNLIISGYIDVYTAYYSDSVGTGNYERFPTSAPRSNGVGLNIAQLSAKYASEKVRGNLTLHYGDIPRSAWSNEFNVLQEANLGFALGKKAWVDAGFFRTHLGCESIQPRENINIGVAVTTYYEPYYFSGVKLSYYIIPRLMIQGSVFNGFNTFVPINKNKTYGFSTAYEVSKNLTLYYNLLVSNEAPDNYEIDKTRFYHDFFAIYKSKKVDFALEVNYGIQKHTKLADSSKQAMMYSGTAIFKHKITNHFAWYARYEIFEDPDEILTGPVTNQYHNIVGINMQGVTAGIEIKPIDNGYFRLESRYIQLTDNEKIFWRNGSYTNERYEILASTGFWF